MSRGASASERRGSVLLWIVALVIVGTAGGYLLTDQAKRFSRAVTQAEQDKMALTQASRQMATRIEDIERERGELTQSTQTLTIDRDNLLAQAKKLMETASERDAAVQLHEKVLKRTAEENMALKQELIPLQQEHTELTDRYETVRKEYETLERELYQAQQQGQEQQLKGQVAEEKKKREQDLAALRQTRNRMKELEINQAKSQAHLSKLQGRYDGLQDKYTGILSENKSLAVRAKKVPKEVTTLAREHERLVKDLADTHYNMGVIFAKDQDYARAVKEFEMVVQIKPEDADAHYNLGLIYAEHLPDRAKAMEAFRRYLEIEPGAKDASWVRQYIASWRAAEADPSMEP